ncbi:uncharacterized protein METZ01_LOCUS164641, partial [marine metagenome]
MIYGLLTLWLILPGCMLAQGAMETPTSAQQVFQHLLDEEWEKGLQNNPEWATRLGDNRFNDRLNDVSLIAVRKRQNDKRELLDRVKGIDREKLSAGDQLNYDLFRHKIERDIAGFSFLTHLMPLDQMGGIQIGFADLPDYTPYRTVQDYENYLARLQAFPIKVEQTIELMQRGIETKWVPPQIVLRSVPDQIKAQFEIDVQDSPLYEPFREFPESFSPDSRQVLEQKGQSIIETDVFPAYKKLHTFFTETYFPACRGTIACSEFPDGEAYYRSRIRHYTTTELTAEEIHQTGLKEVARIREEMQKVIIDVGFEGEFADFLSFLRSDPQFYFTSAEAFLNEYRNICKKADAQLPHLFGLLPRLPYGVRPIPDYQAPASPTAYYYSGSQEAGRPGYFMANAYRLETRPKYEMEALSLHEAVPGHHLQISLAQELEKIPKFRRYGGYTAFVEGWGLYAEKLGEEMGFYTDPYNKFGQLTYEMWRACRLVVDTGMHALGWNRQEAIDFMLSNTAKTENDVMVEIDRYIAWPGQALAYKIGELKIRELRARAEKELGPDFNVRDFHDVVLGSGAVPLDIL